MKYSLKVASGLYIVLQLLAVHNNCLYASIHREPVGVNRIKLEASDISLL